ncbi:MULTISPECIES: hypothetical protein [unclassified Nodularia (in: cyanobacteria)]|uniref:hypothetical protein n=1 Tax=unclassified Nodularia (in: cyanobacteria) TaxID=2656917 RepID=UPI0018810B8F|nr:MULTISPECIES: hypothetical protein [unclassified Nodularia (in: cyanobacteria)]MBE9200284.1 hypothetical protein [Nodularia sp. LEGE 06071]MCC2695867.1 hypothetical protein [Nodularia sp. LEGE 04288]
MLKIKHLQLNWLGVGIICSVISATITPAAAGSVIIINNTVRINQPPAVGSFIYGSPISTPMPVDPATGLIPRRSDRDYHSYPVVSPMPNFGSNPTLINPTLINPVIRNSILVNPGIINHNSQYFRPTPFRERTRVRMNRHRVRSTGRSQVIFNYPW